jgi:hypothetical protein
LHGELHCLGSVVHCSMSIFAGPDLLFRLAQDSRRWGYYRSSLWGWCLVVLSLFVYAVCSIDPALPIRATGNGGSWLPSKNLHLEPFRPCFARCPDEASGLRAHCDVPADLRSPDGRGRPSSAGNGLNSPATYPSPFPIPRLSKTRRWLRDGWTGDVLEPGVLRLAPGEGANARRLDPWPHRHLQKLAVARCVERRRRTRPDSRRAGRNVRGRVRRRRGAVV